MVPSRAVRVADTDHVRGRVAALEAAYHHERIAAGVVRSLGEVVQVDQTEKA
jgi:hypothetical protein